VSSTNGHQEVTMRKFEKILRHLGFLKQKQGASSHTHWKLIGLGKITTVSKQKYVHSAAFKTLEDIFGIPAEEFQKAAKLSNGDQKRAVDRLLVQCGRKAPTTTTIRKPQEAREEIEEVDQELCPSEPVKEPETFIVEEASKEELKEKVLWTVTRIVQIQTDRVVSISVRASDFKEAGDISRLEVMDFDLEEGEMIDEGELIGVQKERAA